MHRAWGYLLDTGEQSILNNGYYRYYYENHLVAIDSIMYTSHDFKFMLQSTRLVSEMVPIPIKKKTQCWGPTMSNAATGCLVTGRARANFPWPMASCQRRVCNIERGYVGLGQRTSIHFLQSCINVLADQDHGGPSCRFELHSTNLCNCGNIPHISYSHYVFRDAGNLHLSWGFHGIFVGACQ